MILRMVRFMLVSLLVLDEWIWFLTSQGPISENSFSLETRLPKETGSTWSTVAQHWRRTDGRQHENESKNPEDSHFHIGCLLVKKMNGS